MRNAKFKIISILFSTVVFASSVYPDTYPKNPKIDVVNYAFKLELSDQSDEISGEATIDVRFLADGLTDLRLDLTNQSDALNGKGMRVGKVISNGKEIAFKHAGDALMITLPTASKANERRSFTVFYHGIPATGLKIADNKYGERTIFSDNWPDKGRNWLPIVDHPYDKAMCEFIVTAPSHYQVVSNGIRIEETDLPGGKRLTHWKQSVPIASWLYVLGVARFAVQYADEFDGKSIQSWVYHQDRDAGFFDYGGGLTKNVLSFYSDAIGPFSYEKLANIQSNSVSGGMEAASAILYGENSVVGDRNIRWRNVIIHEIAHQWFGNAVTEKDWDEVWLSEGFATYFTLLFIEHQYGRDAFVDGLRSSKRSVDAFYAKRPDYILIHDNLKNMSDVTTSQIYQKGSWTLHMLRGVVGTEDFWKGIRNYYRKYRDSNATVDDFRREMEEASGKDLKQFFEQWLFKPGTLKYSGEWKYAGGNVTVKLDQVQTDGSLFKMPVEIAVYYPGQAKPQIEVVNAGSKSNTFSIKVSAEPEKVVLDPNTWLLMDADFRRAD
ncbi:MAG TPA: M1 family metallopeptidase [Pyrinomonadaceae bacterium]|nr:M1 family metallopeptidase [Pyrinomonadaceae bacterium]